MQIEKEIAQLIDINDLPDNLKDAAEICGIEAIRNLILEFGGTTIVIPQLKTFKKPIAKYVLGKTPNELRKIRRSLACTDRYLREIKKSMGLN